MKFNINNIVRVKLTDIGKRIISGKKYMPAEDERGWSEWQMWDLMNVFGEHIYLGMSLPFEAEIEIMENDIR